MSERYYQDYWDWLNAGGLEGTGQQDPGNPSAPPSTPPPAATTPAPTTTTPPPNQRDPRAGPDGSTNPNLDPPGYRGGYWMNGQWVQGSPYAGGTLEPIDGPVGTDPNSDFQWPQYTPDVFNYPNFPGFEPFVPPTMEEILADPGLQAQLKEGRNALQANRAFHGTLRTGSTLKDLFDWTSDRIKLGANDAFDRSFRVYDINKRQNPFNTWSANRDLAYNTFDRNSTSRWNAWLYNEYNPALEKWRQNYNIWAKKGDWLNTPTPPPG